ncbi:MAG: hypothetical protein LM589_05435 [Thermosphaera sp.]|nr:hypothetical protein [Thermosphaera sp.]
MIDEEQSKEVEEEGVEEVGVKEEEEEVEEGGEVVLDQLKLLLDVTKLWRRVLRNEAKIEEFSLISPVKQEVKSVEHGRRKKKKAKKPRTTKRKEGKKRVSRKAKKS